MILSACQGEADGLKASQNSLNNGDLAAAKIDTPTRLLTGPELRDALVGASFSQDEDFSKQDLGFSGQSFDTHGIYVTGKSDFANTHRRYFYIIMNKEFCLYEIETKKMFSCGKVYRISNYKYEFLYEDRSFQVVSIWKK
jgi:hypothetical protein